MAQNSPSTDYLFDFLYVDTQRLNAYYAQLSEKGVLAHIKHTQGSRDATHTTVSGGVPPVAKGEAMAMESASETLEHHYDASLYLPYAVINKLDEAGYIQQGLTGAPLGQLVLIEGAIRIVDVRMMQALWDPVLNLHVQAANLNKQQRNRFIRESRPLLEIIKNMPHAIIAMMRVANGQGRQDTVWTTLEETHIVANPMDITLKYGCALPGEWHMLCLLDAKPDLEDDGLELIDHEFYSGLMEGIAGIRQVLGRPHDAYGVTPVAIFRPNRKTAA